MQIPIKYDGEQAANSPRPALESVPALEQAAPAAGPEPAEPDPLLVQLNRAEREAAGLARDLDNYRRHAEAQLARARQDAQHELLAQLGDVVRDLEQALTSAQSNPEAVLEGVALVTRGLSQVYANQGLQRIDTVGHAFDPALHEAVLVDRSADAPTGTVVRELSPGFTAKDRVVRPAQVAVAG